MPPTVKRPIRESARDTANSLEPRLTDTLNTLGKLVEGEKVEIASGVDSSVHYSLEFISNHYVRSKHAVQTLKAIYNQGLQGEDVTADGLVNLLNINTGQWHLDSTETRHLGKVIDFVQMYGDELMAEALKKAGSGQGAEGQKMAQ